MTNTIIITNDNITNERADIFLSKVFADYTRSYFLNAINSGKVKVNDLSIKPSYKFRIGDIINIEFEVSKLENVTAEDIPLDIIYEDDDILVINKPKGIVVHPAPGHESGTIVNAILNHCADTLSGINGKIRPGIVHRIDKDTSGILLIAKTNDAHRILSDDFKNKRIKRKYIALVHGVIENNKGKIDAPIGRSKIDRKKMCVTADNSKNAVTNFTVLERYKNATLIELVLETGRTHQIRVHMEYINHPVVNDPVYGRHKVINDYGQMLHAEYLGFYHPITHEFMEFSKEPEKEFYEILDMFKNS
jgi:23S rRNA pseudouridine1911/1915/1917 synthase